MAVFPTNGIIQYAVFCVWLLSLSIMFLRFIHAVECISLKKIQQLFYSYYIFVYPCYISV